MSKLSPYAEPFIYNPRPHENLCTQFYSTEVPYDHCIWMECGAELNNFVEMQNFYGAVVNYDKPPETSSAPARRSRKPPKKKKAPIEVTLNKNNFLKQGCDVEWPLLEKTEQSNEPPVTSGPSSLPRNFNEVLKAKPKVIPNEVATQYHRRISVKPNKASTNSADHKNHTWTKGADGKSSVVPKPFGKNLGSRNNPTSLGKEMVENSSVCPSFREFHKNTNKFNYNSGANGNKVHHKAAHDNTEIFRTVDLNKPPVSKQSQKCGQSPKAVKECEQVLGTSNSTNHEMGHSGIKDVPSVIPSRAEKTSRKNNENMNLKASIGIDKESEWEDIEDSERPISASAKVKNKKKVKSLVKQFTRKELLKCFSNRYLTSVDPEVFSQINASEGDLLANKSGNYTIDANDYPDLNESTMKLEKRPVSFSRTSTKNDVEMFAGASSDVTSEGLINASSKNVSMLTPAKKNKKSKDPLIVDLASLLQSNVQKERERKIVRKSESKLKSCVANPLDSTAPKVRRGKERENPKKRRPSAMRKIIQKEKLEIKLKKNAVTHSEIDDVQEINDVDELDETKVEEVLEDPPEMPPPTTFETIEKFDPKDVLHNKKFREYCNQVILKDLNEVVRSFLQDMFKFQDRQYQKNPIKVRTKKRYCVGLREVSKHLANKKIKLVIIAPNIDRIESKGGLDDAVSQIKNISQQQNVPYIFALNRYILGKILLKKVGVSCIGIFDASGSQHYDKMLKLASEAQELYKSQLDATLTNYLGKIVCLGRPGSDPHE